MSKLEDRIEELAGVAADGQLAVLAIKQIKEMIVRQCKDDGQEPPPKEELCRLAAKHYSEHYG